MFLSIMSVLMGKILCWFIFPNPSLLMMPLIMKYMFMIFILMGVYFGYMLNYVYYTCNMFMLYNMNWFLGDMWFMSKLSTYMIYMFSMNYSNNYSMIIDKGWGGYLVCTNLLLSTNLYQYNMYISKYMSQYQYNNNKYYMLSFIIIMLMFFF